MDLNIVNGLLFNSFAEVKALKDELRNMGHPVVFLSKKSVAAHNRNVSFYLITDIEYCDQMKIKLFLLGREKN